MKYLSLCSGIEAATVAWHPLGWEPVAFSEIEPFPSAVLAHHYPNVPNLGDMTKYKEWPDYAINLLVGGTPCQSFSVAGLRKGLDDPRGNLMLTYIAIANRYRPKWVVWENVPGVLSSNGGRDFASLLRGLEECGYGIAYRVLDAQYIRTHRHNRAVPQRRRRVFVVGCLGSWQRAAAVLFERHSLQGNPAPSRRTGERVAQTLAQSLKSSGGIGMSNQELFSQGGGGLTWTPEIPPICMAHGQVNAEIQTERRTALTCNHEAPIVTQYGDIAGSLTARHDSSPCADRGMNVVCFDARQDPVHAEECSMPLGSKDTGHGVQVQWSSGGGNLENDTAQTLRSGAEHNYQFVRQNMQVRRLTPKECERLQGFPDGYTAIPWRKGKLDAFITGKDCPDGPRYKALGNSMAVNVMGWIGERIEMVEEI